MSTEQQLALTKIFDVLHEVYVPAQRTFVQVEVFEHLKSRRSIVDLTAAFEDICLGLRNADASCIDNARETLAELAIEGMFYLCQTHLHDLLLIKKHPHVAKFLLLRRSFTTEADQLLQVAIREIDDGNNTDRSIPDRVESYDSAFKKLLDVTTKVRPHEFYDRVFAVIVSIVSGLVGLALGALM